MSDLRPLFDRQYDQVPLAYLLPPTSYSAIEWCHEVNRKSTHVRIGARDRNRSVISSLVQRQTHHRVMTETRHMTIVQCTVQMYIQNVQCRQPWRNGQKRQHRPARSRRVFSFVVVVALHQLGPVGGFFWGSEGYPGNPQTTNLSTISPPPPRGSVIEYC